jgi:hypothetical protein
MSLILSGTDGLSDVDGSASTPAIRGTDTNTGIFFPAADTIAFAEGGAEVARFDSSGNLGLGVASPTQKLDVSGLVQSQNNAASNDSVVGAYNFYNTNASASANPNRASIVAGRENSAWGAYLQFNTSTGTSAVAERMRIDSSGNLRVGTTTGGVNTRMTVDGSAGVVSFSGDDLNHYQASFQSKSGTSATHYLMAFFTSTQANVGSITHNNSNTTYATSSDYRLKENIAPMTGALAVVGQLKPCTYVWKSTGEASQGFIAHELQEVVPDAVVGEKDAVDAEGNPQYQGIDTSFLVATLTAAIQEQQAIITDLKSRIETLEAK